MVFPQFLKSLQLVTPESVQMKGVDMKGKEGATGEGRREEDINRREIDRHSDFIAAYRRLRKPTASLLLQVKVKPHSAWETLF